MEVLTMKELLETGVHFGHRTRKWNPKMARYIFTERKGIHIIDLEQTVDLFRKAYYHTRDKTAGGAEILFVGTKKQVQATIAEEAQRCGAHYINRRWLGGMLTNFATVRKSIDRMKKFEAMIEDGTVDHMPNKEASKLRRQLVKLQRNLDGLRNMDRKPDLMYVIDPDVETNAVREANIMGIPVIAIVDTNCNPDPIDFLIPGNDDAIKATKLITARIADAVIEGREGRQSDEDASSSEDAPSSEEVAATPETEAAATEAEAAEAPAEAEAAEEKVAEEPAAETPEEAPKAEASSNEEEAEEAASPEGEASDEETVTPEASEDASPDGEVAEASEASETEEKDESDK